MEARARALVRAFEEQGCAREKLLIQIPASWEGLVAAAALECSNIQCEVNRVFSFAQGVQAVKCGVSAVLTDVRRIDICYDRHPGFIRDPMVRYHSL